MVTAGQCIHVFTLVNSPLVMLVVGNLVELKLAYPAKVHTEATLSQPHLLQVIHIYNHADVMFGPLM